MRTCDQWSGVASHSERGFRRPADRVTRRRELEAAGDVQAKCGLDSSTPEAYPIKRTAIVTPAALDR